MKKIILLALASVMFLLPQCKKNTVTPVEDNGFYMTLTAGCGDRTAFTPSTGAFVWSDGATEYIYVGGSNHDNCLGKLSGTGTGTSSMTFSGTLTYTPTEGETLYFFYLGKGAEKTGTALTTLDFSTQDGTLANVTDYHIAIGTGSYSSGTVNYATTLDMKMAIAYFNVNGFKNSDNHTETVYIHGNDVYSTATVDYRNGRIVGDAKGFINVGKANTGKYVALIPSVSTETTVKFDSDHKTGSLTFNRGIQEGKFYANSNSALSVTAYSLSEGAIPGLFSVSATQMVRFSKGNLQYQASTNTWRFAENQYDYVGDATNGNVYLGAVKSDNTLISSSYNGWIDLFGWGTSGYNHGADCYQPYSTILNPGYYFAYGGNPYNLYDQDGTADWGAAANAVTLGGYSTWRTLKSGYDINTNEWPYIFDTRSTGNTVNGTSNARYTEATINKTAINDATGVNGIILFPDNYAGPMTNIDGEIIWGTINGSSAWGTQCTSAGWDALEAMGCVFLPVNGQRFETTITEINGGHYWSSSSSGDYAYAVWFFSESVYSCTNKWRYIGHSVRLVMDVN